MSSCSLMRLFFLCMFFTYLPHVPASSQSLWNLHGTELELAEEMTLMGELTDVGQEYVKLKLEEKGLKPIELGSLSVLDDFESRISLDLEYNSFDQEVYVYAEILDANRKRIRVIPPTMATLEPNGRSTDLRFVLDERQANKNNMGAFKSAFIRIALIYPFTDKIPLKEIINELIEARVSLFSGAVDVLGLSVLYQLPKQWKTKDATLKPTKVTATLKPLGRARSVPQTAWPRYNPPRRPNMPDSLKKPKGPSNQPISLWEKLASDVDFGSAEAISNISLVLYPDRNPSSGVFYYIPNAFHLQWDHVNGYQLKMSYEGLRSNGDTGNVLIAATLVSSITRKEIDTILWMLQAELSESKVKHPILQPMPFSGTPQISLSLGSMYQISSDRISVIAGSTIFDPIEMTWKTDSKTKDDIDIHLLENLGIRGAMRIFPQADSMQALQIPVRMTLADARTFGKFDLSPRDWRVTPWKNPTQYPLELLRMHRLVLKSTITKLEPIIYSWDLGNTEVPQNGEVRFIASHVPTWIDRQEYTKRLWLEYRVVPCRECDQAVLDDINSGTMQEGTMPIYFESIGIIQATGAAKLEVKIRSLQADSRRRHIIALPPVTIPSDGQRVKVGNLFVPQGREPRYEYKIRIITDEMVYDSMFWMDSKDQSVYLNKQLMRDMFAGLPGID